MCVVGAILAGGRSSRFGRDKALLELDGETLLQRTERKLFSILDDVLVVGPSERRAQVRRAAVVPDRYPGIGPLGGIASALAARPGCAILAVAVDMPFLCARLLAHEVELLAKADVVLPVVEGRGQQLHAVYGPACAPLIEAQIAGGDYKIDRFFSQVRVRRLEEDEVRAFDAALASFRNVNSPDTWAEILASSASGP